MADIEIPKYKIIEASGSIEIREYEPSLLAEVEVEGERKEAINNGFRILADYIFGNNLSQQKIAMTAPVTQKSGEKIAMTAPVNQTQEGDLWKIQFTMPSSYTIDNLPKPNNAKVKIIEAPKRRCVAIRFSGFWWDRKLKKKLHELEAFLDDKKLKVIGEPIYAFYNPPWTLPFLRRNEIQYYLQD